MVLELFTLFSVGFITALTPGPDILFTLKNTLNYGIKAGFLSFFGIFCGWIIFLSLVYFGFAHFVSGYFMQAILCALGGIYLSYIAYLLLFKANPNITLNTNSTNRESLQRKTLYSLLPKGLLINLSNPKAILFFGLIITPFIDNHLALSLIVLLTSLTSAFILVIFLATFFRKFISNSLFYTIDKICGILFLCFALLLFFTSYRNFMAL
ncbi:LysE family translocator [Helicobacter sp. MIT 11-5569]|uniref:LysE family translocator n=1 Tax=Helicobacter sp. MIT 11-5569 TaxID=1548151 RepID=UPI00051FCB6C|nr:LysE family translocator [Helicobacter sp. MIT 11-5569]TLD85012.1 LysE family translocator [Helicobacter sp. MIT 11-5569]